MPVGPLWLDRAAAAASGAEVPESSTRGTPLTFAPATLGSNDSALVGGGVACRERPTLIAAGLGFCLTCGLVIRSSARESFSSCELLSFCGCSIDGPAGKAAVARAPGKRE